MRDRPTGPQLLRHARAVLLEELTDLLPEERRHQARLLAEALAIAAREQEAGAGPLEAEWGALAELYGEDAAPPGHAAETLEEALGRPRSSGSIKLFLEVTRHLTRELQHCVADDDHLRAFLTEDETKSAPLATGSGRSGAPPPGPGFGPGG